MTLYIVPLASICTKSHEVNPTYLIYEQKIVCRSNKHKLNNVKFLIKRKYTEYIRLYNNTWRFEF